MTKKTPPGPWLNVLDYPAGSIAESVLVPTHQVHLQGSIQKRGPEAEAEVKTSNTRKKRVTTGTGEVFVQVLL